ncbi:hypothetical protein AMS59_20465 [Lysinibacillus sp. FJAT-14745]|nr:hypothetical protein AMS59_20465 [Lysinibacillus sp. FJAT-14745]
MLEDAGRGYRTDNTLVISFNGGGIPVYHEDTGQLQGIEAVIDKDRSGLTKQRGMDITLDKI